MSEATPPADHDSEGPEERHRRIELHLVWAQLVSEHVFVLSSSIARELIPPGNFRLPASWICKPPSTHTWRLNGHHCRCWFSAATRAFTDGIRPSASRRRRSSLSCGTPAD